MVYGYILSGSDTKKTKIELMHVLGISDDMIFTDTLIGSYRGTTRGYQELMKVLRPSDLVYVKSLDDLGPTLGGMQIKWSEITRDIGADIAVIDMPLLDTRWRKELVGSYVSDIVESMLAYVMEKRRIAHEAQKQGIVKAKKEGVRFGRPSIDFPTNFTEIYEQIQCKNLSVIEASKMCGMSKTTFYRKLKQYREERL